MRQMNPDLVFPARPGDNTQKRKIAWSVREPSQCPEFGLRLRPVLTHAVLDRYLTGFVLAQRCVDPSMIFRHISMDYRQILFPNLAVLPNSLKGSGGFTALGHDNDATRLPIKPIHKVGSAVCSKVASHPANQARKAVLFGRMTNQPGGLVYHKHVAIFLDYLEQLSHCLLVPYQLALGTVKAKWNVSLAVLLMVVFSLTRWPGLMPANFSAAYGLAFCAGVFLPNPIAWWLPLTALAVSDLVINSYYFFALGVDSFQIYQFINYAVYAAIIWLGQRFDSKSSWLKLVSGGILGAILFYLVTNTAAWFLNPFGNPEYTKDLTGWILALTKGTAGWPTTWELFRNTLTSGGLFTGLFAGAMKLSDASETAEEEDAELESESEEPEPEESAA